MKIETKEYVQYYDKYIELLPKAINYTLIKCPNEFKKHLENQTNITNIKKKIKDLVETELYYNFIDILDSPSTRKTAWEEDPNGFNHF